METEIIGFGFGFDFSSRWSPSQEKERGLKREPREKLKEFVSMFNMRIVTWLLLFILGILTKQVSRKAKDCHCPFN